MFSTQHISFVAERWIIIVWDWGYSKISLNIPTNCDQLTLVSHEDHKFRYMFLFGLVYGALKRNFQQYISYIVAVCSIGGETEVSGENHRPVVSHWQTLSHNVVSSTPRHERIRTHTKTINFGICLWLIDIKSVCSISYFFVLSVMIFSQQVLLSKLAVSQLHCTNIHWPYYCTVCFIV